MDSGPLDFDLGPFDCIIFNYCFWGRCLSVTPDFRQRVARFSGLKIAIFQDEYDYFLWHEQTVVALGINTIITCVPEAHWHDVFRDDVFRRRTFINALTGYVPDNLLHLPPPKPLASRQWAIGYRSRPVPFIYGRLTQDKLLIGQRMKEICFKRGIAANIEVTEEARIYGAAWPDFIGNCRTVLGTESGSNVFDFDGTLKPAIDSYLKAHPDADFESVHERFLNEHDGKIRMNQVSPRIFEAIAMRTGLVLFEGEYSGVVRPWEHYIPLKIDFSNIDEVLDAVNDIAGLNAMTERAYADVIASWRYHYQTYVKRIDAHITEVTPPTKGYEPMYGLVGWRKEEQPLLGMPNQNLKLPTDIPLQCIDHVPDPFLLVRCNWAALHRAIMRRYKSILYSRTGQLTQERLMRHRVAYIILRKCVRWLTGRR
ncbi:MAG: hypothetical protein ABI980_00135 [Nitrospirota bacterium]